MDSGAQSWTRFRIQLNAAHTRGQVGVCQAQNVRAHIMSAPATVWAWSCFKSGASANFCMHYPQHWSFRGGWSALTPAAVSGWHGARNERTVLTRQDLRFDMMWDEVRDKTERKTEEKKKGGGAVLRNRRLMCKSSADVLPAEVQVNNKRDGTYLEWYSNKCQQNPLTCCKWVILTL